MRYVIAIALIMSSGCKHLEKKKLEQVSLMAPKVEETENKKEYTRNITIQIMPIQSLTIKAL